jgi:uncharacterized protein (TIGR04255 family)
MSNSDQSLPRFRKPPVVETVLGVYFRPSEKFCSAQQGIVWDRYFRERFPKLEERPPAEEVSEQFGDARLTAFPMVRWQVLDRPDTPRLWAASEDGQHVIQIQKNAFFSNWLKTTGDAAYRPYLERRQEVDQQLAQLDEFFQEQKIGRIEPTSWNVTYINHIDYKGMDHLGPEVAKKLTVWTNQFSDGFLHEPDKLAIGFAFPMPENAGRLNVNLTPVVLPKDKRQALRLDLTARGELKTKDIPSALSAIDLGHEWVVRGFASLTRPEMHQVWEREQ